MAERSMRTTRAQERRNSDPLTRVLASSANLPSLPCMSSPTTAPSPQLFFQTVNAYHATAALKAAVELGLFSAMGAQPCTAGEIAARCQCPERGIRILCDFLSIVGFLTKQGSRYATTPDTAVFLDKNSPGYMGNALKFL